MFIDISGGALSILSPVDQLRIWVGYLTLTKRLTKQNMVILWVQGERLAFAKEAANSMC